MLRIPFILVLMGQPTFGADISYFHSDSKPGMDWVLVNDCATLVPSSKVKDTCYVIKKVNNFCKLNLNLDECK